MTSRVLAARLQLDLRRAGGQVRQFHARFPRAAGGLLASDSAIRAMRRKMWPRGSAFHNAVTVRNVSFLRFLPKLVTKLAIMPAIVGSCMLGGAAWIQYQATSAGNYAAEQVSKATGAVSGLATSVFGTVSDVASQTIRGFDNTVDNLKDVEAPDWLEKILNIPKSVLGNGGSGGGRGGEGGGPNAEGDPKEPLRGRSSAVAGAVGAAAVYGNHADDDLEDAKDDQMMVLTRKMIEIRNILSKVGQSSTIMLPSIVVIGSQSSGKSSVLESIVGHEFLPKGSNMVTRRPIELTLVNTPDSRAEYGEFAELGSKPIHDFTTIQRILTELNQSVSDQECVSDEPIRLSIYSPNVPDLSLIDLPGYIQVVGQNQPFALKHKISELCDKYIQAPNVILAISAADVDLANSAALRASRRVDPRGERTIGVITKMDLVDPVRGAQVLSDTQYPLRMGYVGVISRAPTGGGIFKKTGGNITQHIMKNEQAFFSQHPQEFGEQSGINVGTTKLRKKLMSVLEHAMSANLQVTTDTIQQELDEAIYQLKVQYANRTLSAESYLANSLDEFKTAFSQFTGSFGKQQMADLLKSELDQRLLDVLAERYWNRPIKDLLPALPDRDNFADLPKADPNSVYWHRQLDESVSALTTLGVGRLGTTVVSSLIMAHVDRLISQSTFANHPSARQTITEAASTILNDRFYSSCDQVENCIKPFKYEIDIEPSEWAAGRERVPTVLTTELRACEAALKRLESDWSDRRKLREIANFVVRCKKGDVTAESDPTGTGGFNEDLLAKGRDIVFHRDRAELLKARLSAVKSRQCANLKNKTYCPEIFLDAVASRLTSTAVLFLNIELLSEFYHDFPRELDARLGRLTVAELDRIAKEDPNIAKHLELIRRKDLLHLALSKITAMRQLESALKPELSRREARSKPKSGLVAKATPEPSTKDGKGRWGLF